MATATHLPALGHARRDEAGRELQATLVELVDLALVGKQLHWSVVGPLFRPLHLQLDELVDSWHTLSDTVAERAVAIGVWPDAQASTLAAASEETSLGQGPLEARAVVWQLAHRLAAVSERVRGRAERLAEIDLVSQDVLVEVARELEKQLWMVRAQFADGQP